MKRLKITTNEAGEPVKFDDNENLGEASKSQILNVGDKMQKGKEPKLPIFDE